MSVRSIFRAIQTIERLVIAWGILAIAAFTILNVATRTLLGFSLAYAEELSQFLMILVTFVGLSYGASQGRHIRMTAIYDQLPLRWRKGLMLLIAATTSALMFLLTWYAVEYVLTVAELGTVSPALQVPLYLIYCAAPLGLALAGIQYALTVVRNLIEPDDVYLSFEKKDEYEPVEPAGGRM